MGIEIATIARHHKTNSAQAHTFCEDVLRAFIGQGPSLGIIAWAVQQGPRDSALQVALRIATRHSHFQLTLTARSATPARTKTAQTPSVPRPTQSFAPQVTPKPIRRQSSSQPPPSESLHYLYSPKRDEEQEAFLPGAQRRSSAELKKNLKKGRVSPHQLKVCEHGIRWPSKCKIKGCIFYGME